MPAIVAQNPAPVEIVIREGLALQGTVRGGRIPFDRDPVQEARARGKFVEPKDGEGGWATIQAGADGVFNRLRGAYVFATVDIPAPGGVYLLNARGNSFVYINGDLRPGDVYSYGYFPLPVLLKPGRNTFLFYAGRGSLAATLTKAQKMAQLNPADTTLPDFLEGEKGSHLASIPVLNLTDAPLSGLTLTAGIQTTKLPTLNPLTTRKAAFSIPAGVTSVTLKDAKGSVLDTVNVSLRTRKANETRRLTFLSDIDGSVQYWAAYPAQKPDKKNALVLSLHGASVEAQGQADAYGPHEDVSLAAPTNRRPYGFDWEDWGRLDALEVLAQAKKLFPYDPARVSLTGHSMGGHGTWQLASLLPDTFASASPSAGWISFTTYVGAPPPVTTDPVNALFTRANLPSDTLSFLTNLLNTPVFILHGDADDNVPVTEARRMRQELTALKHPAVQWHEQPGAGHWWDDDPAPGAACVDYPGIFSLVRSSRIPTGEGALRFVTANPAVSATRRWLTIEQQTRPLALSKAELTWKGSAVTGTTENIARLSLDIPGLKEAELDGQKVTLSGAHPARLAFVSGRWQAANSGVSAAEKNSMRSGPFKQAFNRRFVLIYSTKGTPDENAWSYNKARYDAEGFLYRGNGAPDLLPDTTPLKALKDRSVILYGNADSNALWEPLLKNSPVQLHRGRVTVGAVTKTGEDLACLLVRPRPDSKTALVGVVGGTGLAGLRAVERLSYFSAGVAYPDWTVFTPNVFQGGVDGVVGAGIFGNDWRVESGESAWK
ncbi:MAG: prolyl oligopeptidase family serine peptidase [Armatimonas sp.]